MTINRRKTAAWIVGACMALFIVLTGTAMYLNLKHQQVDPITTSIAVPAPKAPREVKSIITNNMGELIITYTDGSTQNAGVVRGQAGKDGQVPSQAQLAAAVFEYCASGVCDAKNPTQEQILSALTVYCGDGSCKGVDGTDGVPVTAEQIRMAVVNYCADGRCKGAQGVAGADGKAGVNGTNADSTVINCVIRKTNNVDTRYVAWKYSKEAVTAYRDIYKLPQWASCENQIDLRSA